ncbi:MAG: tetratricopeptide repeat protein [Deltaproteobacteria bacterium]|nr:tetratricopeptide repeat protein [Deltaproteobacteria bacterium]
MRACFSRCLVVLAPLAVGCATARPAGSPAVAPEPPVVKADPVKVVAKPDTPDALEFYDADILFTRGTEFLDNRYHADARVYFQKLVDEFPDSALAHPAHYNLGVCLMESGDPQSALAQFDRYLADEKDPKNQLDATFKRGSVLAMLGRYRDVITLFDALLEERELDAQDQIEAMVDSGIGYFMTGDRATAEYRFQEAVKVHRAEEKDRRMDNSYFYAQALFYLGEIERAEFNDFHLTLPAAGGEEKVAEQLEEKCQRLLRAQYKFLQVIRTGHAGWASAAGYKVGTLYEDLHDEMVKLPVPPDLTEEQADLYRKEMRRKVAVLVRKAIKVWENTVQMARRTGAQNVWVGKTEQSLRRMQDLLREADESEGEQARASS